MLTERQRLILRLVVDDYVRSAEPVGSRTIAKQKGVTFSPATIRNEMADLEEMGYLYQPHASAGRIPSQKGYRFYVDHLMELEQLSVDVVRKIRRLYTERFMEFEQVIQETAGILSKLTNYTAIVLGPEFYDAALKHIQLVPLTDESGVAIIVTDTGHVEHRTLTVPPDVSLSEMEKLVNLLNDKLMGVPLYLFRERLYTEIAAEMKKHIKQYESMMSMLEQVLLTEREDRVFLKGTTHIFSQPEFRDMDKVRELFDLLEQNDRIQGLLAATKKTRGVQVLIGQENMDEAFSDCSLITASYTIGGRPAGSLNILGPTRMDYKKVVAILQHFTESLSTYFDRVYDKQRSEG